MNNKVIIIKNVVLRYPNLIKKRENRQGDNRPSKYGTTVIISKDNNESIDKINEAIAKAISTGNIANVENIHYPINDGDVSYPGDRIFENSIYFYASSSIKPRIVDKKLNELKVLDDYLNGQYANISLTFCPYNFNGTIGVSAQLHNVQVLEKSRLEELRSNPFDDFEPED